MLKTDTSGAVTIAHLTDLVYELADAHSDTLALVGRLADDPVWAAHVDYLHGLQRVAREALARMPAPSL